MQLNKPLAFSFSGLVAVLTVALSTPLRAQAPMQRDQGEWVRALLDRFHPAGYRLQLGTTQAGPMLGLVLEDSAMVQAPDSARRAKARELASYVLRTARVEPALAVVVIGWKTPGFAGVAREVTFRFAADSLRSVRDSS